MSIFIYLFIYIHILQIQIISGHLKCRITQPISLQIVKTKDLCCSCVGLSRFVRVCEWGSLQSATDSIENSVWQLLRRRCFFSLLVVVAVFVAINFFLPSHSSFRSVYRIAKTVCVYRSSYKHRTLSTLNTLNISARAHEWFLIYLFVLSVSVK